MKGYKRLVFMVLVVILIMSMASTSLAYSYSGNYTVEVATNGTVTLVNYARDSNTYNYYWASGIYQTPVSYTSKAWFYNGSSYENYHSAVNSSGRIKTHYYSGASTTGKLSFRNTQVPGNMCYISGTMS